MGPPWAGALVGRALMGTLGQIFNFFPQAAGPKQLMSYTHIRMYIQMHIYVYTYMCIIVRIQTCVGSCGDGSLGGLLISDLCCWLLARAPGLGSTSSGELPIFDQCS